MKYFYYDNYGKDIVAYAHRLKDKFTDIILNNYIPAPGVVDILKDQICWQKRLRDYDKIMAEGR